MKKKCFCLCISITLLWIVGCTVNTNQENVVPTNISIVENMVTSNPTTELKENEFTKIQEPVFKEKEEAKTTSTTSSRQIITKIDGLCEVLENVETNVETYNSVNRMLSYDSSIGPQGQSLFCLDDMTGVVYFANRGKDNFLYRMKEGKVALAVAMPVKQICPYEGSIYFMVDDYGMYELEGMKTGDIYCYTPSNGVVDLVYEVESVENAECYKLLVEESGIYFCYDISEDSTYERYYYYLPFRASEAIQDKKRTVNKGWNDYYLAAFSNEETSRLTLAMISRIEDTNGERECIDLFTKPWNYCVIGDKVYSARSTSIDCINLKTGERTSYDFLEAMKKKEEHSVTSGNRMIQSFTITEDALWAVTWASIYRMDLETGEIIATYLGGGKGFYYTIPTLYTDGKNVYGFNYANPYESKTTSGMVRLLTEDMEAIKDSGILGIEIEFLTE